MGSTSSEQQNGKALDASVGGLVWVRRRNGSWWPGRIMALDEVSESCLASPKSGTPIKLLGRDDASVDWYNLEKSRRVKPFRCGEYDACIEKAKIAAANASKRVVKYARREDAIIHALELESANTSKECKNNSSSMDASDSELQGSWPKDSTPTSEHSKESISVSDEPSGFEDNSNSPPQYSHSGISYEDTYSVPKGQSTKRKRQSTPNDSEDEGSDGVKRMRGLDDLGLGSEGKGKVRGSNEAVPDGSIPLSNLCAINSLSIKSLANGNKGIMPYLRRKRSRVVHVHEFLKRKHRRRPLTKVLDGLVSVPIIFEESANINRWSCNGTSDGKVSVLESIESKRSCSMVINNNSDSTGVSCENGNASQHPCNTAVTHNKLKDGEISSRTLLLGNGSSANLFDVPIVLEELRFTGGSSLKPQVGGGRIGQNEIASSGIGAFNESCSTSPPTADMNLIAQRMDQGTSKWQLKGKRNSRHPNKPDGSKSRRSFDVNDESNACLTGIEHMNRFSPSSNGKADTILLPGSVMAQPSTVKEEQADGFAEQNKHPSVRDSLLAQPKDELLSDSPLTSQRALSFRHSRFSLHEMFEIQEVPMRGMYADSVLYDVKIEVKESYRSQRVPYISLMSKLNGKPITGHPVVVESLQDGYCDSFLESVERYPASSSCEPDDEDNDAGYIVKRKAGRDRPPTKHMKLQKRISPNKSSKKKRHGSSSKKTRKLSSLTSSQKLSHAGRKGVVQSFKGPALACIPLKIVFSRIHEAVNGSTRSVHLLSPSNNQ